jgi:hypothetical protein
MNRAPCPSGRWGSALDKLRLPTPEHRSASQETWHALQIDAYHRQPIDWHTVMAQPLDPFDPFPFPLLGGWL